MPASGELPRPRKSEACAFRGELGQIDGVAVAGGISGEREIDVASEFRWNRHAFRCDEPLDPAFCGKFDPCIRVVEGASRRGRHARLDMIGARRADADPAPQQIQRERGAALRTGDLGGEGRRAAQLIAEQSRKRGKLRHICPQMRRDGLFSSAIRCIARQCPCRDPDRQRVEDHPLAVSPVERQR